MTRANEVRAYDYVNQPYEVVRDALSRDSSLWILRRATKAAGVRGESNAELAIVGDRRTGQEIKGRLWRRHVIAHLAQRGDEPIAFSLKISDIDALRVELRQRKLHQGVRKRPPQHHLRRQQQLTPPFAIGHRGEDFSRRARKKISSANRCAHRDRENADAARPRDRPRR